MITLISLGVLLSLLVGLIKAISIVRTVTDEEIEEALYEDLRGNPFKLEFLHYVKKRWILLIVFTIVGPAIVIDDLVNSEKEDDNDRAADH